MLAGAAGDAMPLAGEAGDTLGLPLAGGASHALYSHTSRPQLGRNCITAPKAHLGTPEEASNAYAYQGASGVSRMGGGGGQI